MWGPLPGRPRASLGNGCHANVIEGKDTPDVKKGSVHGEGVEAWTSTRPDQPSSRRHLVRIRGILKDDGERHTASKLLSPSHF